jgi:serine/threonine-protein kinase
VGPADRVLTRQEHLPLPGMPAAPPTVVGAPPDAAPRAPWAARAPWLVAAVALLAVVLLTVLLVVVEGRGDDARDGATDAAARLVTIALPVGLDRGGCTTRTPEGDELYVLECPAAGQPEGFPTAVTVTAFAADGAETAVAGAIDDFGLRELEDEFGCGDSDDGEGWVPLQDVDGNAVGRLACNVDGEGDPQLRWYWEDLGVLGFAELRGGGVEALAELRSWWSDTADRGR